MKRFILVPLAILLIGALIFGGCAQPAPAPTPAPAPSPAPAPTPPPVPETIKLKFTHFAPPPTMMHEGIFVPWAKEVEELTGGRVEIEMFPGGALGSAENHLDLVLSGTAEIGMIDPGVTAGVFPLSDAMGLPFLFKTAESQGGAYWDMVEKYLKDTEYKDFKVLFSVGSTPQHIFTTKKQIKTLEDLDGQKIAGATLMAIKTAEALGASGIKMSPMDLYTSLERGLVDGTFMSFAAVQAFKWHEVTKYRTIASLGQHKNVIIMNLDTWNKLPQDIQQIIEGLSGLERSLHAGAVNDIASAQAQVNVENYDKEHGNPEVYFLPDAERQVWFEKLSPIYEAWISETEAKGLPARALFEDLVKAAEKYAK